MKSGRFRFTKFQIFVHVAALTPLALLIWDFTGGDLTANPIQDLTLRTGKAALVLLILSLACTPVNTLFGFRQAIKVRRALGLYAFLYAALHFLIYSGLDYGFDLRLIWSELSEKPYVIAGFSAFLILIPLAITSTRGWQKRLGKRWKSLHRWVYAAGILVAAHYIWVVKSDIREPLIYGGIIALLLVARIPPVRRRLAAIQGKYFARMRLPRRRSPNPA